MVDKISFRASAHTEKSIKKGMKKGKYKDRTAFLHDAIEQFEPTKRIFTFTKLQAPPAGKAPAHLIWGSYSQTDVLKQLQKTLIQPTAETLKYIWTVALEVQAVAYSIVGSIQKGKHRLIFERKGKAVTAEEDAKVKEVDDLLEQMMNDIDFHDNVEEQVVNLCKFGNYVAGPNIDMGDDGIMRIIELSVVDYSLLTADKHQLQNYTKFIYKIKLDDKLPEDPALWVTYESEESAGTDITMFLIPLEYSLKEQTLYDAVTVEWMRGGDYQNKPFHVVHNKYRSEGYEVGLSPLALALNKIVEKLMLEYNYGLIVEKYGTPYFKAGMIPTTVIKPDGTVITNVPEDEDEATEITNTMTSTAENLMEMRANAVIVNPPGWDVEVITPATGIFDFTPVLRYFKGEIMLAFLASLALFDITEAHAYAASKTLKSVWDDVIDSFRRKIEKVYNQQIFPFALKLQGIDIEEDELSVRLEINPNVVPWADVQEAVTLIQNDMITVEEWRDSHNLPPLEDFDAEPPTQEEIDEEAEGEESSAEYPFDREGEETEEEEVEPEEIGATAE